MYSVKRSLIAVSTIALASGLAACGSDATVNPTAVLFDVETPAAATIRATYNLTVGQSVRINPTTTSRTNRLRWSSSNGSVASVSSSGGVSARAVGTSTVTVSGTGVSESYLVNVAPVPAATVTSFSLTPAAGVTLNPGQTQQFATSTTWSDGQLRTSTVTYSATGGTISSTGLYTAGSVAGTFMVIASCACTTPAIADTSFVSIVVPQLTSLTVSPKTASVAAGATQQFGVAAQWNTGATTVPPVTWSASGGSVSASGLYTAPTTAGTYRVIVAHTNGTVRDTATVTVSGGSTNTPTGPTGTIPSTFGPGPNAPAWSNKTIYPQELFNTPIPVHYAGENAAGFKGWQGFDGAWGNVYKPTRVTYPVVSTPLGTKPVLQVTFPGSSQAVSSTGGTSAIWPTDQEWSVRVTGTWSGTLVFERSVDGTTWTPVTMRGTISAGMGVAPSGSQTAVNGVWAADAGNRVAGGRFRVRASSWTSGTANVAVGMQGGEASARMGAGGFTNSPKKFYTRVLVFVDPNWTNGGNVGTKFFFFSQDQGNNHYFNLFQELASVPQLGLQGPSSGNIVSTKSVQNGWLDVEVLVEANTPGVSNGVIRTWVNGVEYLNQSNIMYFVAGATAGFQYLWMDPTYGGGEAPPPRNVFFQLAGWYRESAP